MACEARKENDEMVCRCGKRWDAKDPDPPICQQPPPLKPRASAPTQVSCRPPRPIAALIPATLPPDVAYAMAKAYEANRDSGRTIAMTAAYKIYLDSLNK